MISVKNLLDLNELDAKAIFEDVAHPWEVLTKIKAFILEYAKSLPDDFEKWVRMFGLGKAHLLRKVH